MPNHVKHILKVNGRDDDIIAFLCSIRGNLDCIDFDAIIPMPEFIKIPDGGECILSHASDAAELVKINEGFDVYSFRGEKMALNNILRFNHKRVFDEEFYKHFEHCCKAIEECGYSNWYPWSVVHWGTKWNAYSQSDIPNGMEFQTAWNTPLPIFKEMAKEFPSVTIYIEYASEDIGNACGSIEISSGKFEHIKVNTEEFANSVWGITHEEEAV